MLIGFGLLLVLARLGASVRDLTHSATPTGRVAIQSALAHSRGCVYADPPFLAFQVDRPSGPIGDSPLVDPFGELLYRGLRSGATGRAIDVIYADAAQARLRAALDDCPVVVLSGSPHSQTTWTTKTAADFVARHRQFATNGSVEVWTRKS